MNLIHFPTAYHLSCSHPWMVEDSLNCIGFLFLQLAWSWGNLFPWFRLTLSFPAVNPTVILQCFLLGEDLNCSSRGILFPAGNCEDRNSPRHAKWNNMKRSDNPLLVNRSSEKLCAHVILKNYVKGEESDTGPFDQLIILFHLYRQLIW